MLRLFAYKNTTYKPASIVLMACAAFSVSSSSEKGRLPENQSLYKVITPPEAKPDGKHILFMVADSIAAFALHHLFKHNFLKPFNTLSEILCGWHFGKIPVLLSSMRCKCCSTMRASGNFCPKRLFFQCFPHGLADIFHNTVKHARNAPA